MYSCGPSGKPKGVVLEHVNLISEAMAIGEWHRLSDDQRLMCILPVHHVKGIVLSLITPLAAGGGVVLTRSFQAEKFFERIASDHITVVSVDPGLLEALLHAKLSVDAYRLAHLRHLICGAGPLTVELAAAVRSTLQASGDPCLRTLRSHGLFLLHADGSPARRTQGMAHLRTRTPPWAYRLR